MSGVPYRTVAGLLVALTAGCTAARQAPAPVPSTVLVTPATARLVIPVGREPAWRWNAAAAPDNAADYAWEVVLGDSAAPAPSYQLGFYHFKRADAAAAEGPRAALLAAGQATASERGADGVAHALPWAPVTASGVGDSAVVLTVADPAAVRRLFAGRPAMATVVAAAPGRPERRYRVAVTYAAR